MSPATRRTRVLVVVAVAAVGAWIITISVLILTMPPTGAATPAELAAEATAALRSSDVDAFGDLLAAPLDADFAAAYVERLGGPATVTPDGPARVLVTAGDARFPVAVEEVDGRWYLSALPPV